MRKNIIWALSIFFIVISTYSIALFAEEHKEKMGLTSHNIKKGIGSYTPNSPYVSKDGKAFELKFSSCSAFNDKEIKFSCKQAILKQFSHYEFELDHRESVLTWQHLSTQIILFIVLVLVGMGLYFAWVQFHSGSGGQSTNELSISMEGVKISSPVLGVIILTLSLGFFYLYLVYVYPIFVL